MMNTISIKPSVLKYALSASIVFTIGLAFFVPAVVSAQVTGTIFSTVNGDSADGGTVVQGETITVSTGVDSLDNEEGLDLRLVADGSGPEEIGPAGEEVCAALFGEQGCIDLMTLFAATTTQTEGTFTPVNEESVTIDESAPVGDYEFTYYLVTVDESEQGFDPNEHAQETFQFTVEAPPAATIDGEPYDSIQDAIDDAESGDTIEVAPGTYGGFDLDTAGVAVVGNTTDGNVTITDSVTLSGDNTRISGLTWDGFGASPIVDVIGSGVIIENLVMENVPGASPRSSSIEIHGDNAIVRNSIFSRDGDESHAFIVLFQGPNSVEATGAPSGVLIEGNTLTGGDIGAQVEAEGSVTIQGNSITPAPSDDDAIWVTGVAYDPTPESATVTVENNGALAALEPREDGHYAYYTTIQAAIAAAAGEGTVKVAPGTYTESVTIDKSLTLQGTTDPNGSNPTKVEGRIDVEVDGVTVENFAITNNDVGSEVEGIFVGSASGWSDDESKVVTIQNNVIGPVTSTLDSSTEGIHAKSYDSGDPIKGLVIQGNIIQDISESSKGAVGVKIQSDVNDVDITENIIQNLTGGWAWGISITYSNGESGLADNVSITENTFKDINAAGGAIGVESGGNDDSDLPLASEIEVHLNNFIGPFTQNTGGVVNTNQDGNNALVNATNNWWGVANPDFSALTEGDVNATPWCEDEGCNSSRSHNIEIVGGDTFNSIQEAIEGAGAGDTITVGSGTYDPFSISASGPENISVVAGDGATPRIEGDLGTTGRLVDLRADGVTLRGFEIHSTSAGDNVGISITGQGAIIEENNISNVLTGIQTNTANEDGSNQISDNTIDSENVGISLQNSNNTVTDNNITAALEGLGIGATQWAVTGNDISNNVFTINAGGVAVKTYTSADGFGHIDGSSFDPVVFTEDNTFNRVVYVANSLCDGTTASYCTLFTSIQDAVDVASTTATDTIKVGPGTYEENVVIEHELELIGAGSGVTTIEPSSGRVIDIKGQTPAGSFIDGLTIQGFTLRANDNNIVLQSNSDSSDEVYNGKNYLYRDLVVDSNGAEQSAIGLFDVENVTLDSVIVKNSEVTVAGAIEVIGAKDLTIKNSRIENNGLGFKVFSLNGYEANENVVIEDSVISGNTEGVVNDDTSLTLTATNNFWGNATGPNHPENNSDATGDSASDNVDFDPWYLTSSRNVLSNSVTDGSIALTEGDFTVDPEGEEGNAKLPEGVNKVALTDDSTLDLNSSATTTEGGTKKEVTLSSSDNSDVEISNQNNSSASVSITSGTKISAESTWDGKITPPKTGDGSGTTPSGFQIGSVVVEVGSPDVRIDFDTAVKLTLDGVTGAVAYKEPGASSWTQIETECNSASDHDNVSAPNECFFQEGGNTIIWTYHFTTFGSLDEEDTGGGSSFGGGGGIVPNETVADRADLNNDNAIDILDFNQLMVAWGQSGGIPTGDLNEDGTVDILDFNALMVNWTG